MITESSIDYEKILSDMESELALDNLKKNKDLLFSINEVLEFSIDDFLQYAKNFKHSKNELVNSLYYSDNYYYNYESNLIAPRIQPQRKVLVFRNYSESFKWKEIFSEYKIVENKLGGGNNSDLLYLYFEDEKTAIDAFNFYEKYLDENEEKHPSCFMQCENLKHKILGIKPEDEDVDFKELPTFFINQFKSAGSKPSNIPDTSALFYPIPMTRIKPPLIPVPKKESTPEKESKTSDSPQYDLVKKGVRKHYRYERKTKYVNQYSKNYGKYNSRFSSYNSKKFYDYGNGVKPFGNSYGRVNRSSYKSYIY